jgi:hypothetical protein
LIFKEADRLKQGVRKSFRINGLPPPPSIIIGISYRQFWQGKQDYPSSEFHAWGDSNLYLRRSGGELTLTVEHRAAPSPPPIGLELAQRGDALALEIVQSIAAPVAAPISIDERIAAAITEANRPLAIGELRALCRVRNGTLYERLTALTEAGQIVRTPEGYRLATVAALSEPHAVPYRS